MIPPASVPTGSAVQSSQSINKDNIDRAGCFARNMNDPSQDKIERSMKIKVLTLLTATLLSGCVMPTKQAPAERVTPAPGDRIFAIDEQAQPTGTIVITRDIGMLGGGCFLGVMVDGKMAAHLDRAEQVTLALTEGRHVLTATPVQGRGLCGALQSDKTNSARRRSTEISVSSGREQRYRLYTPIEEFPVIEPAF